MKLLIVALLVSTMGFAQEPDRMDIGSLRARHYRPQPPPPPLDPDKELPVGDMLTAIMLLEMPDEQVNAAIEAGGEFKIYNTPEVRIAMLKVAYERELISLKATGNYFTLDAYEFFLAGWADLRRKNRDLKDAPKLAHVHCYPPKHVVEAWLKFNRAHDAWLQAQLPWNLDRRGPFDAQIRDNQILHDLWDRVRVAQNDHYPVALRRSAMKEFEEHDWVVNSEKYFKTPFPPDVPIWRFREIK